MKFSIFIFITLYSFFTEAVTIAIVDSGIDFDHPLVKNHQFFNIDETTSGQDDDLNGYADDTSGWNFISMGPIGYVKENFPAFEEDFYDYYEIRKKRSLKVSTSAEDAWYGEKRKNEQFQAKRKIFRRFIHGTHVSGLATGLGLKQALKTDKLPREFTSPKLLNITYLGDTDSGPGAEPEFTPLLKGEHHQKLKHLDSFLEFYLLWQKSKLDLAVSYAAQFAQILNASFGIGHDSAGKMVQKWWDHQFENRIGLKEYQKRFRQGLLKLTKEVVDSYPHLVFVFSAGNTKDDTTIKTHYPSGVVCDHCITVGASLGTQGKATFSNYGAHSVSLFAPGVAMQSSVPQGRLLPVNGTSQAAPQVSYVAANIFTHAWKQGLFINTSMVKEIILSSVDKKLDLKTKSESGGILNPLRAIYLTKLLQVHSLVEAKRIAYLEVADLSFLPKLIPLEDNALNAQETDSLSH